VKAVKEEKEINSRKVIRYLRFCENSVLRKILGLKMHEIIGDWRTLQNEELHNLYSSRNIIRMIKVEEDEVGSACSKHGEQRNAYRVLVGKPEGKTPLLRPRRKWQDSIQMDLREIEWGGMDWIHLV
jgi:hypothetical protein